MAFLFGNAPGAAGLAGVGFGKARALQRSVAAHAATLRALPSRPTGQGDTGVAAAQQAASVAVASSLIPL